MARWRLRTAHYIRVPGTEWQYAEQSQESGEQAMARFPVPRLLDPNDPRSCRSNGECIVAYKDSALGRDWVIEGPPTPDMEPLDDEAKAISAEWEHRWTDPIESLPGTGGFSQSILQKFEASLAAVAAGTPVSIAGASDDALAKMQKQIDDLVARNAALAEQISEQPRRR